MTAEKPVVYVVDDDPSVGKALERLMRSAGHDLRTFTSPKWARNPLRTAFDSRTN
jgi:FixJ family two-component response regulator